jgi:uncharacterized membrane protein YkvA (DUF1232 family)
MAKWMGKKSDWRAWLERKRARAEKIIVEPKAVLATSDQALAKAERVGRRGKLRGGVDEVFTLGRLARAWARGEYRHVSRGTVVMVLAALVYFLSPLDAILDGVPVLGLIDDAAVLAWVVSEVRAELDEFRAWEATQVLPLPST